MQTDLLAAVGRRQPQMLEMLRQLVNLESPTEDWAAVNRCVSVVEGWIKASGGKSQRSKQKSAGDLLIGRFGPAPGRAKPLMLLGHLDTVWPLGTLKKMPFRVAQGRAWGPGVLDMKAGVVMALTALRVLLEAGQLTRPVVFLLNSDEETGSLHSRALTESLAKKSEAVFVLEPAQAPNAAYKTARKGVGHYHLQVHGVPANSGVDFHRPGAQRDPGASAADRASQRFHRSGQRHHGQCGCDRRRYPIQRSAGGGLGRVRCAHRQTPRRTEVGSAFSVSAARRPALQAGGDGRPQPASHGTNSSHGESFPPRSNNGRGVGFSTTGSSHWWRFGRKLYLRAGDSHIRRNGGGRGRRTCR